MNGDGGTALAEALPERAESEPQLPAGSEAEGSPAASEVSGRSGRHRRSGGLRTGGDRHRVPLDRTVRLRLLFWSALGIAGLIVAQRLQPDAGSLFAPPSDVRGWASLLCGVAGVWLVPGLLLSGVMMRTGAGLAAWLGCRIATTLCWYALAGPVIHFLGQGAQVTTGGILIATVAAAAAFRWGRAAAVRKTGPRRFTSRDFSHASGV